MKIVVDAFGGDYAPFEIIAGAVKALQENQELEESKKIPSQEDNKELRTEEKNETITKDENKKPDTKLLVTAIIIVTTFTMLCACGLILIILLD